MTQTPLPSESTLKVYKADGLTLTLTDTPATVRINSKSVNLTVTFDVFYDASDFYAACKKVKEVELA